MNKIIAPVTIGLIFLACLYFLFYRENDALQIHSELESLKTEIEIDIMNEDYNTASKKLIQLVHPSSDYSTIERNNGNDSGFWNNLKKNSGISKYRYNEYWSEQRKLLLDRISKAKKSKGSR